MPTSGPVDPEFGQRSAFPIDAGIKAPVGEPQNGQEYVLKVRQEAETMARRDVEMTLRESTPKRPPPRNITENKLIYDEVGFFKVAEYTKSQFGVTSTREFRDLVASAHEAVRQSDLQSANCDSQATWKEYIMANEPQILDHSTNLRVIKYLARWGRQQWTLNMAKWAWVCILRLPDILTSDEMALVRDLVRARESTVDKEIEQYLHAIRRVAVDNYGQADLAK